MGVTTVATATEPQRPSEEWPFLSQRVLAARLEDAAIHAHLAAEHNRQTARQYATPVGDIVGTLALPPHPAPPVDEAVVPVPPPGPSPVEAAQLALLPPVPGVGADWL